MNSRILAILVLLAGFAAAPAQAGRIVVEFGGGSFTFGDNFIGAIGLAGFDQGVEVTRQDIINAASDGSVGNIVNIFTDATLSTDFDSIITEGFRAFNPNEGDVEVAFIEFSNEFSNTVTFLQSDFGFGSSGSATLGANGNLGEFTPVPVPAPFALIGLGLLGGALVRRRG